MIAFQIIGGMVTGAILVTILYERITTGTIVDAHDVEMSSNQQSAVILIALICFIAIVGPALMPAAPGVCL